MGLQSALTTALTGLQAAEATIDVVGNNVANSQTVGFKESSVVFATQFLQTLSIGSAPSTNSGGTNPRQIGLGVKVAEISTKFTQGTIEISANPLDVAIQGDGFLVVQAGNGELYTRNGQLKLNAENEIVTATGQRVLGFGVNDDFVLQQNLNNLQPLTIPLGKERVSQATANASFSGVLNPSVDIGATPSVSTSIVLGDGTVAQPQAAAGQDFDINDFPEAEPPNISLLSDIPANDGSAGPGAGTVTYRFTFLDSNGEESAPSADYVINNPGLGEIQIDNIPTGTGPWVERRIYRTEASGNTFYPITTIANNVDTTYTDQTADGAPFNTQTVMDDELIDPGSYSYYVSYYDPISQVETRPTARIGTRSLSAPGGRVRIDLSQVDPPSADFTQVRIYRNLSDSNTEFLRIHAGDIAASATSFVDNANDATLQSINIPVDLDGPESIESTPLVDLVIRVGETYVDSFFKEGTLTFSAQKDGSDVDPKELAITPTTDVLELMTFIRETLGIDTQSSEQDTPFPTAGSVSLLGGQIVITSNLGEENAVEVPLTAFRMEPSDGSDATTLPLTFNETQLADGPGTTTEMIVYDSLGLPLNVRITTVLEEKKPNETVYRWYATSGENEPFAGSGVDTVIGDGLLRFDANGDLIPGDQRRVSILRNVTASESPLEVELDFSQIKALGETNAQGDPISTLNLSSQDGFPPGVLTDFIITNDGTIQGQFSNGTQRTVGQMVMARFANAGGLQQVGDSLFNIGVNSGVAIKGVPGADGIGTLTAGAVELSNTDIGQNLIELILASTQYRGGARVITATQELLDELLALSR
ncbi:MAG: flagellar hook-basal body complex protein [Planctomycetes bacterium]|nr:flagellar hook-basal body complex protein [Planctomycetota bacterium]